MIVAEQPGQMLTMLMISAGSALLSALLILLLRPILVRYAMAKPNARSSHRIPVPQGAGMAVIAATVTAVALAGLWAPQQVPLQDIAAVLLGALFIAVVGGVDDWKPVPVVPRLFLQLMAATAVLAALPHDLRILSFVPTWIERALLAIAIMWFVNLTNFMDGLDWMTVAEMLPITAALAAFSLMHANPPEVLPVALALAGALIGFAPFNKPVAKIFLGDVGSLPIGLIVAWGLVVLAGNHHLAAAILLPLYYLADATVTLFLRLSRGEQVWKAHRTHFYQRATNNGFSVIQIVCEVLMLNVVLVILATLSIRPKPFWIDVLLLAVGAVAVAIVLFRFSRPRSTE